MTIEESKNDLIPITDVDIIAKMDAVS